MRKLLSERRTTLNGFPGTEKVFALDDGDFEFVFEFDPLPPDQIAALHESPCPSTSAPESDASKPPPDA